MLIMEDYFNHILLYPILFNMLILTQDSSSLKLIQVTVPQYKLEGEETILECNYELERDRLYTVTWYKDDEQFYRFIPKIEPKKFSYEVEGFVVDHKYSNEKLVMLKRINLKASGVYKCEVSAEAPSFTSVHGEGVLQIISLPQEGPEISGEQKVYKVGETISLNCTSGQSYPPARLKWFVNDRQVGSYYEDITQTHGLLTTVVGLKFVVRPQHIAGGTMVVRCVATISTVRDDVRQHVITSFVDNREALLLVQGHSARYSSSVITTFCLLLLLLFWTT